MGGGIISKRTRRKFTNNDDDFFNGEEVTGHVVAFVTGLSQKPLYILLSLSDGRRTRIYAGNFYRQHLNPEKLTVGDELTIRKVGYFPQYKVTNWRIISVPHSLATHTPMRHLSRLLALEEEMMPQESELQYAHVATPRDAF